MEHDAAGITEPTGPTALVERGEFVIQLHQPHGDTSGGLYIQIAADSDGKGVGEDCRLCYSTKKSMDGHRVLFCLCQAGGRSEQEGVARTGGLGKSGQRAVSPCEFAGNAHILRKISRDGYG